MTAELTEKTADNSHALSYQPAETRNLIVIVWINPIEDSGTAYPIFPYRCGDAKWHEKDDESLFP